MAVVSISRIQIRRGKKNSGTGLPQLASGELAWAIDAQELYIGNGSVSEGAPAVGNTKVLTDKDNIFSYAENYEYRDGEVDTGNTVRTLQSRLDDRVSVRAFGAIGDNTVQTTKLQRAITELFLNSNPLDRTVLHLDPGEYVIDSTIYLPPHTTIVGAGKDKTIIRMVGTGTAFRTVNDSGDPANDPTTSLQTQSRYMKIQGFSLEIPQNVNAFELQSCRDSVFQDIKITGNWESGVGSTDTAIVMSGVLSRDNKFKNIDVETTAYSVVSNWDIKNNIWQNCKFESNIMSVKFGDNLIQGQVTGPVNNTFENCVFNDVERQAIYVANGLNNVSKSNKFYSVGNNGGGHTEAAYPVIQFDSVGNVSEGDWFERSVELGINNLYDGAYISEIEGQAVYQNNFVNKLQIPELEELTKIFRLPADSFKTHIIEYTFQSTEYEVRRQGVLEVTIDPTLTVDPSLKISLSDDYNYIGNQNYQDNITFEAVLDENTLDSVGILMLNSTIDDTAEFHYRVKTKS